jgi:hypothetical protein
MTDNQPFDPTEPEVVEAISTLAAQGDPPIDDDDREADAAGSDAVLGGEG